jgi:putative membrane protein
MLAVGAILGLKIFSKILNWLFKNYKDLTLAMLTGFMIGSLNKIWPWKKILTWRVNSKGFSVPLTEQSILPTNVKGDNQFTLALVLITIGFVVILLLEKFGPENEK